jgi:AraC-like DNA-binding protein
MGQVLRNTFDTRSVAKADRLDFWEERTSADIAGHNCSSMEEDGFQAKFEHYDFTTFSLFEIVGKQHVVSRPAEFVRKRDKDSVFLMLLMSGSAFVNRNNKCKLINRGDLVLYDTNAPYMHGFPEAMHHVIFDLPGAEFRARFPGWDLKDTLRISGSTGSGVAIANFVRKTYSDVRARKYLAPDPNLVDEVWTALELTSDLYLGGKNLSSYQLGIVQRVNKYVRAHIGDTDLNTEKVASEIGMSSRQLNRILALNDLTVKKLILEERLSRARRSIETGSLKNESIAELAYRCGFSAPSQFTRAFRKHFGVGPTEIRCQVSQ